MRRIEGGRIVSASEAGNRLEFEVDSTAAATLVVRDAWAPGWSARVDGRDAPLRLVEGHYRGVDVGPGRSRVHLLYRPPGLAAGLALAALGLAFWSMLGVRD